MSKSLLKQTEQNVVNRAKAYNDALEFVDALNNFGNRACHDYIARDQFFEGLKLIRSAIRAEQSEALRECFYLSAVGGKEVEDYSKQMFKHVFGGKFVVMSFLEEWGHVPSSYSTAQREALEAECKQAIKGMENDG